MRTYGATATQLESSMADT